MTVDTPKPDRPDTANTSSWPPAIDEPSPLPQPPLPKAKRDPITDAVVFSLLLIPGAFVSGILGLTTIFGWLALARSLPPNITANSRIRLGYITLGDATYIALNTIMFTIIYRSQIESKAIKYGFLTGQVVATIFLEYISVTATSG
jgi:hypothetical protein